MRKILVLVILIVLAAPFLPTWHGRAETVTTISASGDAYVDKGYPTKVLGARTRMRADRSPLKITYLRFPSGCAGKCSLSIYSDTDHSNGPRVYTTRNFSESTLTWNSQPARGVLVADFGPIHAGWNTVTLKSTTARVFRLEADSSTQLSIYSREGDRSRRAKLVTGAGATTPSPTPTTVSTAPDPTATRVPTQPSTDGGNITFPVRAAFYYPWFPNAWTQSGIYPYSKYEPKLGYYDGSDPAVISAQIDAMLYGGITVGIASWWGQGHHTDQRVPALLQQAEGTGFRWAFYYEPEGTTNPSQAQLASDLTYLVNTYGSNPNAARVDGRLVVFVYNANDLDCSVVDRYKAANTAGAYIVLKVFSGYRTCATQPDGWHQYAPAVREDSQAGYSYAVSPSFDKIGEATRLARDITAWPQNVRNMVASGAPWQLVTTFNEWGEGTGVESSKQYPSSSGYGYYLDVLHSNGGVGADQIPTPTATVAQTQVAPTATAQPTPPRETSGFTVGAVGDIMHETSATSFKQADQVCQLASQDDLFLALGDIQYENGSYALFLSRYDVSTCGAIKPKTKPVPGNHEYLTAGASGYYQYFGPLAGDPAKGYYSFTAGKMHFIAINSNCSQISGGCGTSGAQYAFIKADLAANPTGCTVAYWHHPRYSSGQHGDNSSMDAIWDLFANNGGDVVLAGHDHTYERFAPIDAAGTVGTGVRSFVVGTGGKNSTAVSVVKPGSQVRITNVFGILRLSSDGGSYSWQFVGIDGKVYDSGTSACVNAPTVEKAEVSPTPTSTATAAPTATPVMPTSTAVPTITPAPTSTAVPTDTVVPTQTATAVPTEAPPTDVPTEVPTDTPTPVSTPGSSPGGATG